ncbi:unnamed protein product, partial [marine sediment metagenome]
KKFHGNQVDLTPYMDWVGELIGLSEFNVIRVDTRYVGKVIIDVETKADKWKCPKCGELTSNMDHRYPHRIRDNSAFGKQTHLMILKKVFYCRFCDYAFVETLESVHPGRVYTKRYERRSSSGVLKTRLRM